MELVGDPRVNQDQIDLAVQFGIDLDNSTNRAQEYVVAFFHKLLMQREKLDQGLLTDFLKAEISKAWQEVLSCLEDRNRRVVDVQSGSLIFVLFCPITSSLQQLKSEDWMRDLTSNLKLFLRAIGTVYLLHFVENLLHL